MMNYLKNSLSVLLLLLSICVMGEDNKILVHGQIDAKSFYIGAPFSYTLLVDGSDLVDQPQIPQMKDIAVKLIDSKSLIQNGKKGFEIQYLLVPEKDGELTVEPFTVSVKGKTFKTSEYKINVKKPASNPGLKLSIELSKTKCYVGEPILMTFTWYSVFPFYGFRGVKIDLPIFHNSDFNLFKGTDAIDPDARGAIGLPVSNLRIIASQGRAVLDGKPGETLRFTRVVVPNKAGTFNLKPATLLTSFLQPGPAPKLDKKRRHVYRPHYPSYFNNNFFDDIENKPYQRFFVKSNELTLEVLPLPAEDVPEDFFGIVGKCDVETTAKPTKLHVGDPMTFTIRIKNYAYPSVLNFPPLSYLNSFSSNFLIPSKQPAGVLKVKDMVFERTICPLRVDVAEVPQIRVPYFDPATGKYAVSTAPPIKIEVIPAEVATTFDAELSGDNTLVNKVDENPEGIRHNIIDEDEAFEGNVIILKLLFMVLLILPPMIFLIIMLVTSNYRMQMKYPARALARSAARRFYRRMKGIKIDDSADRKKFEATVNRIDHVFRQYFAEKFNLQPYAHTFIDLDAILRKKHLPPETIQEIKRIYDECAINRYTDKNLNGVLSELKNSALNCVKSVERFVKR